MAILDDVKTALRISHSSLDSEITGSINAAKAELERAGISSEYIDETTDPLIHRAVLTFCKAEYATDPTAADKFQKAFESQMENLRKSPSYFEVDEDDE